MPSQLISLSASGVVVGTTLLDADVMDDGSVNTYEKVGVYCGPSPKHAFTVLHTGNNYINNLPVDLVVRHWIQGLRKPRIG
jgi:hypothetical protein